MEDRKVKACPRCQGKGYGSWRPMCGDCYKCKGAGQLAWVSKEELLERYESNRLEWLAVLEAEGRKRREQLESNERLQANPERLARVLEQDVDLRDYRRSWLRMKNREDAPRRGKWEPYFG